MGRAGRRTRIGGDDAKKELEMKPTLKIALAFVALSSALATTAYARDGGGRHGDRQGGGRAGMMPPLEMLDADKNGDVTLEEFTKVANERFASADADKDGKLTVAEVAGEIEKMRAEQMAKRMIARFDANDDGVLTAEEVRERPEENVRHARQERRRQNRPVRAPRPLGRQGHARRGQ